MKIERNENRNDNIFIPYVWMKKKMRGIKIWGNKIFFGWFDWKMRWIRILYVKIIFICSYTNMQFKSIIYFLKKIIFYKYVF